MTAADRVPGEFVKVSVHRQIPALGPSGFEPRNETLWYFARYIATIDAQIVIELADGDRNLVDADHVHALDAVPSDEAAS